MATPEETLRAIESLSRQAAFDLFKELQVEIGKFANWSLRQQAFLDNLSPSEVADQSLANILKEWEKKRRDDLVDHITSRVAQTLKEHGFHDVSLDDVKSCTQSYIEKV